MSPMPPEAERFIVEHIGSVQELEILLLLFAHPEVAWTGEAVALELKLDPGSCADWLTELSRRGFAAQNPSSGAATYISRSWVDSALASLAYVYAHQWQAVIRLICSKPNEKVQVVAHRRGSS